MSLKGPGGKYIFGMVKVGTKGQIVIPKEAREVFAIHPGDTLILLGDKERGIAIPPKNMFASVMSLAFGDAPNDDQKEGQ